MELLSAAMIGVGLAADAFAVSLSSGFIIKHIKIEKALKIALFFGIFQAIMPLIGWLAGLSFRELISAIDHWIIFFLLAAIGGKMIYEALQAEQEKLFNPLDFYTLLGLSLATSLDALGVGVGLSVVKTPMLLACTVIGVVTFFLSFFAVFIGHKFGDLFKSKIEVLGGFILIGIGFKILLEHLSFLH